MIGGMDMNQMLAGLGSGPGQFGLEGYNSPSGMHGNPMGGGNWQNALAGMGKSFGNMGHRQAGEAEPEMQQPQQPDIQSILSQLFQDRMGEGHFGGRYANYLGGQDGLR